MCCQTSRPRHICSLGKWETLRFIFIFCINLLVVRYSGILKISFLGIPEVDEKSHAFVLIIASYACEHHAWPTQAAWANLR